MLLDWRSACRIAILYTRPTPHSSISLGPALGLIGDMRENKSPREDDTAKKILS